MELAGRYFGSAFGSAPIGLMMQGTPEEEMSLAPFTTMGDVSSTRLPEMLKPIDYAFPKQKGKFSTLPSDDIGKLNSNKQ